MAYTFLTRPLFAALALLMAGGVAVAQSPDCQRYRAELASLGGGGGGGASAAAQSQRGEIARLSNYYRSIGCERGPFAIFSGPPPAECGPLGAQLRQMESNYARLAAQADTGAIELRRRQLQAAVQQTCSEGRGFFETLFGGPRVQQPPVPPESLPTESIIEEPRERSLGGRRLVCVKTCDGSFFPLANAPGGRENADEMCQSLCPGTETRAFATSGGGEALDYAVSLTGQPYTSLAGAFKYRKAFDESCACKKDNQSWAMVLRKAESMLEQKKGDILVTAEKAEELSRPKAPTQAAAKKANDKTDKKAVEAQAAEAEAAAAADAAPTATRESSGIGPQSIEASRVVGQAEGQKREIAAGGTAKKTVRVVAPDVIPVPNAK